MNEKETRRLKEILFALIYAKYLAHGTDGHNARMIIADLAEQEGYSFDIGSYSTGFTLYHNNVNVLETPRLGEL